MIKIITKQEGAQGLLHTGFLGRAICNILNTQSPKAQDRTVKFTPMNLENRINSLNLNQLTRKPC